MMMEDGQGKYKGGKHKGKGKGKNRGQNQQMGFEKLNLTDEQKAEMKTIMSSQKGQKRVQKTDTERLAQQAGMQTLMQAGTFDEAKAEELISEQQSKRNSNELEKMKELCNETKCDNSVLAPMYYAKMLYYDELFFRVIEKNVVYAKGGRYKSAQLTSVGFAIYTDSICEALI